MGGKKKEEDKVSVCKLCKMPQRAMLALVCNSCLAGCRRWRKGRRWRQRSTLARRQAEIVEESRVGVIQAQVCRRGDGAIQRVEARGRLGARAI